MTTHTLNSLVEEAAQRAAVGRAEEAAKRASEAAAAAKMRKETLAKRVEYIVELLPSSIWAELGLDLDKLCQKASNQYNYYVTGELALTVGDCSYKADTSVAASYPQRMIGHKPETVSINIQDEKIKLYLIDKPAQYRQLNLIGLSELLHQFIEEASKKKASLHQEKKRKVWRSLDAEDLSSERCEQVIAKLEKSTWPRKDVKELLERAKVRLESIKAREADMRHDQQLLEKIWQMAKDHVAQWEAYGLACGEWAEQAIEEHWHPFTLYALRFAVSGNNTETVYCLSDQPDQEGYLKVVTPDGTIIEKRFCRQISWQKETFDKRPSNESASYCNVRIPAKWGSFTVSLPPADIHNREIDPIALSESQPSPPMSWWVRIEEICDLFINKEWAERVHGVDPEDVAKSQMSSWFQKLT